MEKFSQLASNLHYCSAEERKDAISTKGTIPSSLKRGYVYSARSAKPLQGPSGFAVPGPPTQGSSFLRCLGWRTQSHGA